MSEAVYSKYPGSDQVGAPFHMAQPADVSTAGNVTLTPAQFINSVHSRLGNGGARDDTTPTALDIVKQFTNVVAGKTAFQFYLRNKSATAVAITLVGGTNVTIVGTAAIAQNKIGHFVGTITAVGATPTVQVVNVGIGDI